MTNYSQHAMERSAQTSPISRSAISARARQEKRLAEMKRLRVAGATQAEIDNVAFGLADKRIGIGK